MPMKCFDDYSNERITDCPKPPSNAADKEAVVFRKANMTANYSQNIVLFFSIIKLKIFTMYISTVR